MNVERSVQTERGQALVIMAFGVIVLLIVAGLAIDGGTVYMERRHAQNAADAGALAGTRMLAEAICDPAGVSDGDVWTEIVQIVASNNVQDPGNSVRADYVNGIETVLGPVGSGAIPPGATGISATVHIERDTYFLRLAGIDAYTASAYALAMTGPPLAAGGLRPFGVPHELVTQLNPEDWFKISFDPHGGGEVTSTVSFTPTQHLGWMNLGYVWNSGEDPGFPRALDQSANANTIRDWMENGWQGTIYPDPGLWALGGQDGDFIHAKPGVQAATICDAPMEDDFIFPIPIYDKIPECETQIPTDKPNPCPSQGSGYAYHIVGIASVRVKGCDKAPEHEITLQLVEAVLGEGMPKIGGGTGYGEPAACETHTQVVTLWK
jgi:hypothetical protein